MSSNVKTVNFIGWNSRCDGVNYFLWADEYLEAVEIVLVYVVVKGEFFGVAIFAEEV